MELGNRLEKLVGATFLAFGEKMLASVLIQRFETEQLVLVVPSDRGFGRSVVGMTSISGHRPLWFRRSL